MKRLSWPPSGPLTPGDAFDAGRADVRRLLRPPHRAASHPHSLLTPLLAAATVAPDPATPRARSTPDPSVPPPWLAYRAATVWPSPSPWSAQTAGAPGAR